MLTVSLFPVYSYQHQQSKLNTWNSSCWTWFHSDRFFRSRQVRKAGQTRQRAFFSNHPPYQPLAGWHEQIVVGESPNNYKPSRATSQHFWVVRGGYLDPTDHFCRFFQSLNKTHKSQRVLELSLWKLATCKNSDFGTIWLGATQRFFIFTPTWGRFPIWLIFFKWIETTNKQLSDLVQSNILMVESPKLDQKRPSISTKTGLTPPSMTTLASNFLFPIFFPPLKDPLTEPKRLFVGGQQTQEPGWEETSMPKNMRSESWMGRVFYSSVSDISSSHLVANLPHPFWQASQAM